MKLPSTLESEILQFMKDYWCTYLSGDLDKFSMLIRDDFHNIGTTETEDWRSKEEVIRYSEAVKDQLAGTLEIRNLKTHIFPLHPYFMVHEYVDLYINTDGEWVFYSKMRLSSLIEKNNHGWQVIHQHGSVPDNKAQEGETVGFQKISQENLELRDAIKRRTIELEQKNRALEIEAALDHTRTQSLLMQHSDELLDISKVFHEQLLLLGIDSEFSFVWLPNEEKGDHLFWATWMEEKDGNKQFHIRAITYPLDMTEPYTAACFVDRKRGVSVHEHIIAPENIDTFFASWTELLKGAERLKPSSFPEGIYYTEAFMKYGCFGIDIRRPLSPEEKEILHRFAIEFERSYTRFLDLKKAEAQAREAQIEAALERVRSRSMAMHKSEELSELSLELVKQVQALGVATWFCAFNIHDDDLAGSVEWGSNGQGVFSKYRTPRQGIFLEYYEAWQRGEGLYIHEFTEDKCPAHYEYLCSLTGVGDQLLQMKAAGIPFPKYQIDHVAFFKHGYLLFITYEPVPESHDIFKRFAKVFEQSYTRFLDLQKAEAQMRESQIEVAVERVRTKALAMHRSDEIHGVVRTLRHELFGLNLEGITGATICLKQVGGQVRFWDITDVETAGRYGWDILFDINEIDPRLWVKRIWDSKDHNVAVEQDAEDLKRTLKWLGQYDQKMADDIMELLSRNQITHGWHRAVKLSDGILITDFANEAPDEIDPILLKMGAAFDIAYKRFLDLQNAEAQAREAQIEAALERVRSRSLAMHHSSELSAVVDTLLKEFTNLEFTLTFCIINLIDEQDRSNTVWAANPEAGKQPESYYMKFEDYPFHHAMWDAWKTQKKRFIYTLEGEEKRVYDEYLYTDTEFRRFPKHVQDANKALKRYVAGFTFFKYSGLQTVSEDPITEDDLEILERFGRVFEQSYTRFLDLQKAEAQAKEVQVELSLEKIRAQVTSMQESSDMLDIMVNIRSEFVALGHEAHYFWYMRWLPDRYEKAMTSGDGTQVGMIMTLPRHIHGDIPLVANWEQGEEPSLIFAMDVDTAVDYVDKMITLGDFVQVDPYAPTLDDIRHIGGLTFVMARTSQGEIGYSLPGEVHHPPNEAVNTLARFAGVFDLAYRRFEDLKKAEKDLLEIKAARKKAEEALDELKATQSQLIQQEKLASLGQLTAGIAHEIQNPLNFVNNFSEVSIEFVDETIEEVEALKTRHALSQQHAFSQQQDSSQDKESLTDIGNLLGDIKSNLEKINHHGQRAAGIVRGMLEHSRKSDGKKELTDVNALCDEYLRLSYHGYRAKDQSFNATIETHFDPVLPKVSIIPQEIGRVILNIFNNAFYAINERSKIEKRADSPPKALGVGGKHSEGPISEYIPSITVRTKSLDDKIEITINDNGNGIPDHIKDKIFQPFFTTKPTGQGTGLGLSLAYDIVTKGHGGEMKVETKDGEGSKFIIMMPVT